jgi:hypothetical protein
VVARDVEGPEIWDWERDIVVVRRAVSYDVRNRMLIDSGPELIHEGNKPLLIEAEQRMQSKLAT